VAEWPPDELEAVAHCPACGATDRTVLYEGLSDRLFEAAPGAWRLLRCGGCGSAYLDPRPTEASIGHAYATYYTHGAEPPAAPGGPRRALQNAYINARWGYALRPAPPIGGLIGAIVPLRAAIADRELRHQPCVPGGRLLDVGAGNGALVAYARRFGWDAAGIDPDAAAVATARDQGIPMKLGTLADVEETAAGTFDSVTLSHVIEHLHDPARDLRRIHRLLAPNGRVWIATPNLEALGHRLFGRDWVGLDPPRHLVLFTTASLQGLLRRAGFVPEPTPRPAPTAWAAFSPSGALRDGCPPDDGPQRGRRWLRARAVLADRLAYASPKLAEELLVIAARAG
jgi:SAM-dependent methyltransferase